MIEHDAGCVIQSFLEKFGPGEGFNEVMGLLQSGAAEIIPVLEDAGNRIDSGDWNTVVRAAHRTANFAAAVNDSILNEAAVETERAARGRDANLTAARCPELAEMFKALAEEATRMLEE